MQDEGFHLPSQEAKAALNSATSLCKWFDSDQAKDMIEEFNKTLKTSLKECIQNAVQQGNVVKPSPAFRANWTQANWEV